ncbi:MAG: hypothetical protein RRZ84_02465 [Romboutsia sp.]
MCLYSYSNKTQTNSKLDDEQYNLLNQIYKSIEVNDNDSVKSLTNKLISLQSSKENIDILQNAINSLQ